MQRVNEQIKASQSEVSALHTMVVKGSNEIARIRRQLQAVSNEKNVASIREAYPILGERIAGWRSGYIDPTQKKAQDVYISLVLEVGSDSRGRLNQGTVAQAMTLLQNEDYRLFLGGVTLYATPDRTSQGLFSISDCSIALSPASVYRVFSSELKETAARIKTLIRQAQIVPDDRFSLRRPGKLTPLARELLQKSGLDILVVLGGASHEAVLFARALDGHQLPVPEDPRSARFGVEVRRSACVRTLANSPVHATTVLRLEHFLWWEHFWVAAEQRLARVRHFTKVDTFRAPAPKDYLLECPPRVGARAELHRPVLVIQGTAVPRTPLGTGFRVATMRELEYGGLHRDVWGDRHRLLYPRRSGAARHIFGSVSAVSFSISGALVVKAIPGS